MSKVADAEMDFSDSIARMVECADKFATERQKQRLSEADQRFSENNDPGELFAVVRDIYLNGQQ